MDRIARLVAGARAITDHYEGKAMPADAEALRDRALAEAQRLRVQVDANRVAGPQELVEAGFAGKIEGEAGAPAGNPPDGAAGSRTSPGREAPTHAPTRTIAGAADAYRILAALQQREAEGHRLSRDERRLRDHAMKVRDDALDNPWSVR